MVESSKTLEKDGIFKGMRIHIMIKGIDGKERQEYYSELVKKEGGKTCWCGPYKKFNVLVFEGTKLVYSPRFHIKNYIDAGISIVSPLWIEESVLYECLLPYSEYIPQALKRLCLLHNIKMKEEKIIQTPELKALREIKKRERTLFEREPSRIERIFIRENPEKYKEIMEKPIEECMDEILYSYYNRIGPFFLKIENPDRRPVHVPEEHKHYLIKH